MEHLYTSSSLLPRTNMPPPRHAVLARYSRTSKSIRKIRYPYLGNQSSAAQFGKQTAQLNDLAEDSVAFILPLVFANLKVKTKFVRIHAIQAIPFALGNCNIAAVGRERDPLDSYPHIDPELERFGGRRRTASRSSAKKTACRVKKSETDRYFLGSAEKRSIIQPGNAHRFEWIEEALDVFRKPAKRTRAGRIDAFGEAVPANAPVLLEMEDGGRSPSEGGELARKTAPTRRKKPGRSRRRRPVGGHI